MTDNNKKFITSNMFRVNNTASVCRVLKKIGFSVKLMEVNGNFMLKIDGDSDLISGMDEFEILMLRNGTVLTSYATEIQTPQEALSEVLFKESTVSAESATITLLDEGDIVGKDLYSFLEDELLPDEHIKLVIVEEKGVNDSEIQILNVTNTTHEWSFA